MNIDGVDATELVTLVNSGTITGDGVTRDGDGVDVDGLVNLTNNTGGVILSKDAYDDASEGVTVGGGTIVNAGTIEGSVTSAGIQSGSLGRGITLAGVDKTVTSGTDTSIPIQKIYGNTTVTNNSGGLIKGDTDSGIAILGVSGSTNYSVTITNNAGATIEGAGAVAVIDGSANVIDGSTTNGAIGTASANNETVIDSGTIKVDGTGKAISLGSGTNSVQITGGSASINGDISGGTSAGSNTLTIDPNAITSGQTFSYGHVLSNFSSVVVKSGTVTLSGANIYTGSTTSAGGTTYIDNASGSGTGTGAVSVSSGAALGGTGIIQSGTGNGVTLTAHGSLISGGVQAAASSSTIAGQGLTLDNTLAKSTILDASLGNATLTFYLGANNTSSYMKVVDDKGSDTVGELKFAASDTIMLTDLTNGGLHLNLNNPYLLIQAGSNADYSGLTTTGDINGLTNQNGYVITPLTLSGNTPTEYSNTRLYLNNGDLEVVPEPGTWAMLLGGLGVLILFQHRRVRRKILA